MQLVITGGYELRELTRSGLQVEYGNLDYKYAYES